MQNPPDAEELSESEAKFYIDNLQGTYWLKYNLFLSHCYTYLRFHLSKNCTMQTQFKYNQGTTDLPIKPINRPILPILPIIGITDHINPYIGSVSDRPILRPYIG